MTISDRFWKNVDKLGPEQPHTPHLGRCWTWTGRTARGYGQIRVSFRPDRCIYAHRLSWKLHFNILPKDLFVLHRCDNRKCVNPDHLFLGTHADNMADMAAKGRGVRPVLRPAAKLSLAQVENIKVLHAGGLTQRSLAKQFGVSFQQISRICRGERWAGVSLVVPCES